MNFDNQIEALFLGSALFLFTNTIFFVDYFDVVVKNLSNFVALTWKLDIPYQNTTHHIVLSLIICNWSFKKSLILVGIEKFYQSK